MFFHFADAPGRQHKIQRKMLNINDLRGADHDEVAAIIASDLQGSDARQRRVLASVVSLNREFILLVQK